MEVRPQIANFTAGEVSPKMLGQTTFAKYPNACELLENFFLWPQGMVSKRPGSRMVQEVKDSSKTTRLIPFEFSVEQAYVLEFGDYYIRFYTNHGRIEVAGQPLELETPYSKDIVFDLGFQQSADVLFIMHQDFPTYRLERYSNTSWRIVLCEFDDGPYLPLNVTNTALSASATKGLITLSAAAAGSELIQNGDFTQTLRGTYGYAWNVTGVAPTDWTFDTPCATHDSAEGSESLYQLISLTVGKTYIVKFDLTVSAGGITPVLGGTAGTYRNAPGTYQEEIVAGGGVGSITFTPDAFFNGTIDNVSVAMNGTSITFFTEDQVGMLFRLRTFCHPTPRLDNESINPGDYRWTLMNAYFTQTALVLRAVQETTQLTGGTQPDFAGAVPGDLFADGNVKWKVMNTPSATGHQCWVWGSVKITKILTPLTAEASVKVALGSVAATVDWREGAWGPKYGYPRTGCFFGNRLMLAGTKHQPQTVWGSKVGDYYNMTPDDLDDAALAFTLNSDQVNAIKWMASQKVLLVGASRGQWVLGSTGTNEPMTPSNVDAKQETRLTSSRVYANCDHTVLFWQEFGRALQEISYRLESDSYAATPLTVLAEHIGRSPIREMTHVQEPLGMAFSVRTDGQIATLTYERQHEVIGWCRWKTDGVFESIARIPGSSREEIWTIAKRTIDGVTKRYVEYFEDLESYETADSKDMFYVDSGLTYSGAPTTTISGLGHLEGKTVQVFADGYVHPDRTVSAGEITLQAAASKVQVGLPYTAQLRTVRIEVQVPGGTVQGRRKRISSLVMRFMKSYYCKTGASLDGLDEVHFKVMGGLMDQPVVLYSGDKEVSFPGKWDTDGYICVTQPLALPLNLVGLMPKLEVEP